MTSSDVGMNEYDFSLRFDTSAVGCGPEECVERLAASGCDDAIIGIGIPGRIALDFIRRATIAEAALVSAIRDVLAALPQARLIEASPDFVGFTDVAELVGKSRQNMRKLLLSPRTPGPIPVHEGVSAVWHLSQVLRWLRDERGYPIEQKLIELADVTMAVNIAATRVNFEFTGCGESLSRLVSGFLALIDTTDPDIDITPRVRSLRGAFAGFGLDESDYRRYLEEKYR
ncbi:MAG: hypothetical protein KKA32_04160 [Actinobacteria bacterium]|nr:hypothetical protein [Actinomycetota bacterium]